MPAARRRHGTCAPRVGAPGAAFTCPAEAWTVTVQALWHRAQGARPRGVGEREGTADDVLLALRRAVERGRIGGAELAALHRAGAVLLGAAITPPDPALVSRALAGLGAELVARGLVESAVPLNEAAGEIA
jgi:hypothetical protein